VNPETPGAADGAPSGARPAVAETSGAWHIFGIPLARVQTIVGLIAGLLSIGAGVYSFLWATRPAVSTAGEVVTVVFEANSSTLVPDAVAELFSEKGNALVTTLTPQGPGRARQTVKEGTYRLRVTHPRYVAEVRQIQVLAGQTAEVRVRLAPRVPAARAAPPAGAPAGTTAGSTGGSGSSSGGSGSNPAAEVEATVRKGVDAVKRVFK